MRKLLFIIVAFLPIFFASCSNDTELRAEIAKIVEARSPQDVMNDLYLACDDNIEALARILQITPSSIQRIRTGETEATEDFEEKLKSVAVFYFQNGRNFPKLRSVLDPQYAWYDSVMDCRLNHPTLYWAGWPVLIIINPIAWIAYQIYSPEAMEDKYTEAINPVVEQLI